MRKSLETQELESAERREVRPLYALEEVLDADAEISCLIVPRLVADNHARQEGLRVQHPADSVGALVHVQSRAHAVAHTVDEVLVGVGVKVGLRRGGRWCVLEG